MKNLFLISFLLLICSTFCFSQIEKIEINGIELEIRTSTKGDMDEVQFINIYKGTTKLFSHTIANREGDAGGESIELGSYELTDSTIVLYSYWATADKEGRNLYPFGFRKVEYLVEGNGIVYLFKSGLYIESLLEDWDPHSGMKYLNESPKTKKKTKLLEDYISKAEKMYGKNFVLGHQKDLLEKEVRFKLKAEIENQTKDWDEFYPGNCKK